MIITRLSAMLLMLTACQPSQKIYQAPAMGAEAQFDKGLRPEKHPQYLFDKKTMKDMRRQGNVSRYTRTRRNTAPTIPLPKKNAAGSDSATAAADSSHTGPLPADSLRTVPDTTHIPR
ncbi:hypothetical protein ECE50_006655 [Chitinophaga sp. Mgbs1]|uniref:Lipoprotein n=1 Tax=Chitinophaga solisilvae TaxID=1233460 RepID=A0A9Q5D9U0_9BACT|nr:hypothetical protein [Chitinophaga solisilvae]